MNSFILMSPPDHRIGGSFSLKGYTGTRPQIGQPFVIVRQTTPVRTPDYIRVTSFA
jgi:hypothetical protein